MSTRLLLTRCRPTIRGWCRRRIRKCGGLILLVTATPLDGCRMRCRTLSPQRARLIPALRGRCTGFAEQAVRSEAITLRNISPASTEQLRYRAKCVTAPIPWLLAEELHCTLDGDGATMPGIAGVIPKPISSFGQAPINMMFCRSPNFPGFVVF